MKEWIWPNFAYALILTTSSLGLLSVNFRQFIPALEWSQKFVSAQYFVNEGMDFDQILQNNFTFFLSFFLIFFFFSVFFFLYPSALVFQLIYLPIHFRCQKSEISIFIYLGSCIFWYSTAGETFMATQRLPTTKQVSKCGVIHRSQWDNCYGRDTKRIKMHQFCMTKLWASYEQ